ncbi:glycosyltransferase [Actinospica durhamensis]|uniref:4,4'-diaponeurosporenoate glycosyltransferase n=1 Tax=Actinospica durhamensis TaxID=1508375 RepID=A0A941ESQ7_9ACTN|nr:glycosyltransferase [Actinospica durhamensis]MBR7836845.1 glycosyltransferase [Actinospica durhamensis]
MKTRAALAVTQLDLDLPDGPLVGPAETTTVLALIRLHRHPLGVVEVRIESGHPFATRLRRAAVLELGPAILEHELRDQAAEPMPWELAEPATASAAHAFADPSVPPCLRRRATLLGDPPSISVVVGTREQQPDRLARCLDSLAAVRYPRYEVLVVDSAPETDATRRLVNRADGPVRYLRTRRPGRAAVHELGAAEATGRLLAFTGDDVRVDRDWLPALAESFADAQVGCVAGLTMPVDPPAPPRGILSRGGAWRGATPGLNLAVDADLAHDLRGFDPDAVAELSARAAYQPDAVVWHQHRGAPVAALTLSAAS